MHGFKRYNRHREDAVRRLRDDFPSSVKQLLARRVGVRCSNPDCRKPTSGPHEQPEKAVSIGVASHISAAAPGGPRYDSGLSATARRGIQNGIWLCQSCAKLIDSDQSRYDPARLRQWKRDSEAETRRELEGASKSRVNTRPRPIRLRLDLLRDLPYVPPLDS
jgi:hypothetical protein